MRKFLLLISVMLPCICNAQLNVRGKTEKIETIASARMGYFTLKCQGDKYYFATNTTNRFDDPFIFDLGEDMESSIKTIEDILGLFGSIDKGSFVVVENRGIEMHISQGMTKSQLYIQADHYAGIATMDKAEIEKLYNALKQRSGQVSE